MTMVCEFTASVDGFGKVAVREDGDKFLVIINGRTVYEKPRRSYFFIRRSLVFFEHEDGMTIHEIEKNPLYPIFEVVNIFESTVGLSLLRRRLLYALLTGWRPKPIER